MSVLIQLKRASASFWSTNNPSLDHGEPGWERDTNRLKIGQGPLVFWNDIPYLAGGAGDSNLAIVNAGNNRVFVSDGTTTNIKAQSNLTFNGNQLRVDCECPQGNAGFEVVGDQRSTVYRSRVFSDTISAQIQDGDTVTRNTSRLVFFGARGSSSSPSGLQVGDVVFNIRGDAYNPHGTLNDIGNLENRSTRILGIVSDAGTRYLGSSLYFQTTSGSGPDIWDQSMVFDHTGSLKINSVPVSLNGHTHISSEITDFDSSVNELLPTISNSGNDRLLTSDGTNTGINAESNLTLTTGTIGTVLTITHTEESAHNSSSFLKLRTYSNNSGSAPRIQLDNLRGTEASPLPIESGDTLGVIGYFAPNSSGILSNSARIFVGSQGVASGENNFVPTRMLFNTSSGPAQLDNSFQINSNGNINTNCDIIIAPSEGRKTGVFFAGNPHGFQIFNSAVLNTDEVTRGSISWSFGRVEENTNPTWGNSVLGSVSYGIMSVSGSTSSTNNSVTGTACGAYRNTNVGGDDNGVADYIIGSDIQYGHAVTGSGNGVTTFARGLNIQAWAGGGTIQTAYDIYLAPTNRQEAIGDGEGGADTITGNGTINRFGIVQASPDPNVLNGSLTATGGLSAPTKIHDLGFTSIGNIDIDYGINKQIQKIGFVGDFPNGYLNFNLGSNWPINDSVDVFLELTVVSTVGQPGGIVVDWPIVSDWYNQQPPTLFTPGKYLFLFRSMGSSTIQGHYLGSNSVSS